MSVVLREALYPRVSTDEQKKFGLSIHDQQNDLEEYAKANNMKVVGVFPDAGFSARKKIEKRPAMLQLLEAVKRDEVDIILVTKLDRWFRNIGEYYKVQEILEAHNVSWKTIYEDYDTSTAAGRLKINIMLAVAQDEADRASERIKKVLDAKKDRNEVCTGHLPKGYKIEGKFAVIDKFFYIFGNRLHNKSDGRNTGIKPQIPNSQPNVGQHRIYGRLARDKITPVFNTAGISACARLTHQSNAKIPLQSNVYFFGANSLRGMRTQNDRASVSTTKRGVLLLLLLSRVCPEKRLQQR